MLPGTHIISIYLTAIMITNDKETKENIKGEKWWEKAVECKLYNSWNNKQDGRVALHLSSTSKHWILQDIQTLHGGFSFCSVYIFLSIASMSWVAAKYMCSFNAYSCASSPNASGAPWVLIWQTRTWYTIYSISYRYTVKEKARLHLKGYVRNLHKSQFPNMMFLSTLLILAVWLSSYNLFWFLYYLHFPCSDRQLYGYREWTSSNYGNFMQCYGVLFSVFLKRKGTFSTIILN